jgi:hypothetical protein
MFYVGGDWWVCGRGKDTDSDQKLDTAFMWDALGSWHMFISFANVVLRCGVERGHVCQVLYGPAVFPLE